MSVELRVCCWHVCRPHGKCAPTSVQGKCCDVCTREVLRKQQVLGRIAWDLLFFSNAAGCSDRAPRHTCKQRVHVAEIHIYEEPEQLCQISDYATGWTIEKLFQQVHKLSSPRNVQTDSGAHKTLYSIFRWYRMKEFFLTWIKWPECESKHSLSSSAKF